ncbi:hypothetical protein GCM10023353_36490 [Tomitella cavernea]|uniref:Apea-like HEPN domain-containing protein n=1 Tax=Tomitella cavernea TaxID=1387982 RepID=A0ABP9D0F8_9ACTN
MDDTLASASALSMAFEKEQERVDACTARLRRTRNAAIHGGPISIAACETVANFARQIAGLALANVIEAIVDESEVEVYTSDLRTQYRMRVENLVRSGNLENLFEFPAPTSPQPAS